MISVGSPDGSREVGAGAGGLVTLTVLFPLLSWLQVQSEAPRAETPL